MLSPRLIGPDVRRHKRWGGKKDGNLTHRTGVVERARPRPSTETSRLSDSVTRGSKRGSGGRSQATR